MKQKIYNKNHQVVLNKQYYNPISCISNIETQQSPGFIDYKSKQSKDSIINATQKIQTKISIKPTKIYNIKQRYQTKSDGDQQNSQIYLNNSQNKSEQENVYKKIKNISNQRKLDILSLRSKKSFKISRQSNNNFYIPIEDVSLNKIDPKRVSRYNKSMSTELRQKQKFDKSLQRYMLARTKMSQLLDKDKKNNGEFQQIQLNKSNRMLQNRKLNQLKILNSKQKYINSKTNQFVSYLIPKVRNYIPTANTKYNDFSILQNQMIKSVKGKNNNVKRCDALLVNFVGTYFRKKFYKKSKKIYSNRRTKTDDIEMVKMIGLEGNQINDEIISQSFSFNPINFEQIQKQNIKKIKIKI